MSQLFSRVFLQILDSSIAEDWVLRHVFEDFLKLVDYKTGVVDMTREAMSRRLNIPLKILNEKISILESADPKSRDQEHEGRRLERLDEHRDWGWKIINHEKYDEIRTRADVAIRVQRHRSQKNPFDAATEEQFEKFWSAYPHKVSKVDARRAFTKAVEKVPVEKLISAVEEQRKWDKWTKDNGAFIPHAATWLNQERWNDERPHVAGSKPKPHASLAEVMAYAKEKWGDNPSHANWATSFFQFWNDSKRNWRKNGMLIDWKIKFTEQVAGLRR